MTQDVSGQGKDTGRFEDSSFHNLAFHFALFSQSLLLSGTTGLFLQTSPGYKMHWNDMASSYSHLQVPYVRNRKE